MLPNLLEGDAFICLDTIPNNSVQLTITSPPYNIGKIYERGKSMNLQEYTSWIDPIIDKLCAKATDTGSICWQVGNYVDNGEIIPLDIIFYNKFRSRGFKLRNRIIWRFNFGLHATKRFSGRYETLLWFTRGENYVFNLDPVRVPQIYPGKRHAASKGNGKAGKPSGNPLGKNPADFWEFSAKEFFVDNPVWEIPNVKANHPEHTVHPCQFPNELAQRCVLALTREGDIVLDPFAGAGTSVIAALAARRQAIGIDKSPDYIKLISERVNAYLAGRLRFRPSGLDAASPRIGHAVTTPPSDWQRGKS